MRIPCSLAFLALACGANAGLDAAAGRPDAGPEPCVGLVCQQVDCPGGGTTSVTGTVHTPAGNLPLYNVIVYVPNAPVQPFTDGVSCDRCDDLLSGAPLVRTTTDTEGRFALTDMPVGVDIPLVIQVGKWRRQVVLPAVSECVVNPVDPIVTRLPRNQQEGDLPRIALATGGADALECFLRKVGIDDAEFTNEGGGGRVTLFTAEEGSSQFADGVPFAAAAQLWEDPARLAAYDVLLMSCEGSTAPANKTVAARQNLVDYTAIGGRVFASHWHNYWIELGPEPWPQVAAWNHQADLPSPFTALIDQTFEKGMAFAEWLLHVGGSVVSGELEILAAQHTIDTVNPTLAQQWIYSTEPQSVQYLTFNTPIDVAPESQCGRLVLSDIHVSAGDTPGAAWPNGCTSTDLLPQEKALMFMLFDLSSCIEPDID